jgi:hypothetical protein
MAVYNNVNNLQTLVTPLQVMSNSITNLNFDTTLISMNMIKLAEINHLEKPLSRLYYEELVTENDAGTLSVANQTLMNDYLIRTLSWFVKFEIMNDLQYNTSNSGITTNIDDFSTAVSQKQYDLIKQDTYRKATVYLNDMIDFLHGDAQISAYPTFRKNAPNEDGKTDSGSANKNHGIIFY